MDNAHEGHLSTLEVYLADKPQKIGTLTRLLEKEPTLCSASGQFSPWKLYIYYLRFDVLVLCMGLRRFREALLDLNPNLDVLNTLTISSYEHVYGDIRSI